MISQELDGCVRYCLKHGKDDLADSLEPIAEKMAKVEAVLTDWNFGPLQDRDALVAIHNLIGDNIQGAG